MKIEPENRSALVDAAMGRIPCDLAIRNVRMLNVFTGEIYAAEVGVLGTHIACVSADPDGSGTGFSIEAREEYDGRGMFLIPGFIDAHVHIESSMVTCANMAAAVVPQGTTTLVTDPHEVANVGGLDAVRYMIESSRDLPLRVYVTAPSCVPAVPGLEGAGAVFGAAEMEAMLGMERVLGLAELMDVDGILNNSARMRGVIDAGIARGAFLQGHAPFVSGRRLNAYLAAGPESDHESRTGGEAREKLRLGMFVDAREGAVSSNVGTVAGAVKDFRFLGNLCLCTDDREPEALLRDGHMNLAVKSAVNAGLSPEQAIRCATLNVAREVGLRNLGGVAPGWVADLQIVPDLSCPKPVAVFHEGRLVAENGRLTVALPNRTFAAESLDTMKVEVPSPERLRIAAPEGCGASVRVNVLVYDSPNTSLTSLSTEEIPVRDGFLDIAGDPGLKYAAVLNRHGAGNMAVAVVRDFGSREGAVASSVSHDSHNLAVVYDQPENALVAIRALIASRGGHCAVRDGAVVGLLPLPIYGLLSPLPCGELAVRAEAMKTALRSLGIETKNPLMRITSLALPVIPKGKLTDRGLVDVVAQKIVPLFAGA